MDVSVDLDELYDFANPCNYENSDILLSEKKENPNDEEVDREGIFVVNSEFTSLLDSNRKYDNGQKYYSIYDELWDGEIIYNDKVKALEALKESKHARLKWFYDLESAKNFATNGGDYYDDFKFPTGENIVWKMPRSRDLVKFRRAISSGNLKTVIDLVEENPRYLVGSGDTPTILQGGCRYNALHVATMARSAEACSYILSVASDLAFGERLYGKNQSNQGRSSVLLDLFLNMPDKGNHETPLHFASKLGAIDVIKVLISYPQCDKNVKNKSGLTALEIVCSRLPNQPAIKNEIINILGSQYFVPLFKSTDNAMQPVVGELCSSENPPLLRVDLLASPLEVRAVAGPMSEELALRFRKKWKTPPRNLQIVANERPHLSDPEKGFEKLGRKLAGEFQVGWKEYWSFLDTFVDLSSKEGLSLLEGHLKEKYEALGKVSPPQASVLSFNPISQLLRLRTCFRRNKEESSQVSDSSDAKDPLSNSSTLSLNRLEHDNESNSISAEERRFNFSPMDMDKYYELFAKRITEALISKIKSKLFSEMSYFQRFLSRCSRDKRFCDIDLTQTHYRLSVLISKRVLNEPESLASLRYSMDQILNLELKDVDDNPGILEPEDLLKITTCLLNQVNEFVSNGGVFFELDGGELHSMPISCDCKLADINIKNGVHSTLSRRLSFSDGEYSSDSEESFHTAWSGSEDTDDDQLAARPGVFLTGSSLTKVDVAVFEAIESVCFSPSEYPHVSKWKTYIQENYEKKFKKLL